MRVLHVVPTYLPAIRYGGPIQSVHGLCAALARLGHDVDVYTTSVDGASDSDVPHDRPVVHDDVRISYFRSRRMRRLYWSPPMRDALRASIRNHDILHLHSVFLWPTSMAARLAVDASIPHVLSPRGMLAPATIREKSRIAKTAWLTLVESETLAGAGAIHLTSERELREARRLALPLPSPFVIPNGVDVPSPSASGVAESDYALFLGRLSWIKGLDRLLDAIAGTEVRVIVCGPDDDGCRVGLEAQAQRLGIERQVEFRDPVQGSDKWSLLAGARFLVLPSHSEGFGNAVVEALAVGRPVVVTEAVGAAEVVRTAGAGLVCSGEAAALRECIVRLWRDRHAADAMGEAGRRYAAAHLSWDAVAAAMADRYRRVLDAARNDRPVDPTRAS